MDLALAFEDSQPFKLTVEQYQALAEAGAFDEQNGRVELIEGMIVCMSPQASAHTVLCFELAVRLREALRQLGSPYTALTTPTVAMPPHNAPDPDIAVTTLPKLGPGYFPLQGVRILIEISRTTLNKDMRIKRDIYARAGVPEYWVVDVRRALVHRFWQPSDGAYRQEPPIPLAGLLTSLSLPDLVIDGSGIL